MENACPKCGAPKSLESCPKCGLIYARYNPLSGQEQPPSSLAELWEYVENNWQEAAAHAMFIEQAFFLEQSGFAARCYRQKGDDETARVQLVRIVTRMESALLASKTEPAPPRRASRTILLAALFILAASAGAFLMMHHFR